MLKLSKSDNFMKKNLLKILENWEKYYIYTGDLRFALNSTSNSLHGLLKRAVQKDLYSKKIFFFKN